MKLFILFPLIALAVGPLLLSGCQSTGASPREAGMERIGNGRVFGHDPSDPGRVADYIAERLARDPIFASVNLDPAKQPVIMVVDPEVRTRDFRLAAFDAPMFSKEVLLRLMNSSSRRARFVTESLERWKMLEAERERILNGLVTNGADNPRVVQYLSADFFLCSNIQDMTRPTGNGYVTRILYSFELINRRTREIQWADGLPIMRQLEEPKAYR